MPVLSHDLPFDPTHGYSPEALLAVMSPEPPGDFADFWRRRHAAAMACDPRPWLRRSTLRAAGVRVYDCGYQSTDAFPIGGWLVLPESQPVTRGLVVSHGYGGRDGPDLDWSLPGTALLFPCCRGLCRSARHPVSTDPAYHVLHDIDKRDRYILGGCVEDIWLGVSLLLDLYPALAGHVGFMGISFGGGVGVMALPWDERLVRAHVNVPSFGHQSLRVTLPSRGSNASVAAFQARHGHALETLRYYDAASAARFVRVPVHVAAAAFDPVVPPAGQYAVYNALAGPKRLFPLTAGHHPWPGQAEEEQRLREDVVAFFSEL
ncbi:MAG: acetylxylan esterase [Magnetococcus sp. WYHC-3]